MKYYFTCKTRGSNKLFGTLLSLITFMHLFSACSTTVEPKETLPAEKENMEEVNKDAERQRVNALVTKKNMNFRNNWENYIKISNDEPKVDYTFGGISSFNVFLSNETTYMLDQVDIYVEYIRKNGEMFQSKTVSIFNIPAGATESVEAPSSLNGVRVRCEISKIISKKMHFCYPTNNGNPDDPYFCK